jgi:hypothetical protein
MADAAKTVPDARAPGAARPAELTLTQDLISSYVYVDVTEAIRTTSELRRDVSWLRRFRERSLKPLYRALIHASAMSVACAPISLTIPATQLLLDMDFEDFCREIVVVMIGQLHQEVKLAKIQHRCVHRGEPGAEQLVQQLTVALLVSGYAEYASKVMHAFIKECSRVHWVERQERILVQVAGVAGGEEGTQRAGRHTSRTIASYIAPAVIMAVDYGVADQVARVQKRMVDDGHFDVVCELVTYIASDAGRPDTVALGTLQLLRRYGDHGVRLASAISSKSFADRARREAPVHPDSIVKSIATVASIMYLRSSGALRTQAAKTIAMAAVRGCIVYENPSSVVKVSYYMKQQGGGHAVSLAMLYMQDMDAIADILITSLRNGFVWLVAWLFMDMLSSGFWGAMAYSTFAVGWKLMSSPGVLFGRRSDGRRDRSARRAKSVRSHLVEPNES